MKSRTILTAMAAVLLAIPEALCSQTLPSRDGNPYVPSDGNLEARTGFQDAKFGIFLHWGLYSMLGTGEWTMTVDNINYLEYAKLANAFYPHDFDAGEWVSAIKRSGAGYICFTSRHHDGFSMWDTEQSDYNIVDGHPLREGCRGGPCPGMRGPGPEAAPVLFTYRLVP